MSRDAFIAFRRSPGRTAALDRMTVRVRGLDLAEWTSPPVAHAPPLLLVNGGLLYDQCPPLALTHRRRDPGTFASRGV